MVVYSHLNEWEANYYVQVVSQLIKYEPTIVAMDANVSPDVLSTVIRHCNEAKITSEYLVIDGSH